MLVHLWLEGVCDCVLDKVSGDDIFGLGVGSENAGKQASFPLHARNASLLSFLVHR